ncbi:helix-turn-helix transcriptional regulator [Nocardia sp. NPDC058666]|uniref:helix-turn-helix transcriptional regulator n=1 Tax=Nocardia sp. NPDC058666 TaxID=3346587 RepID=UPI00365334AB
MSQSKLPRVRDHIARAAAEQLDWVSYSARVSDALRTVIPHERCCWHTVDPGTILFTGSVNYNIGCSGSWLARYEYEVEDVNKWSILAHSGRLAGALSLDTDGDMSRSARHRSQEAYGVGDELRVSLVSDGIYWGAAAFLRNADEPCYTAEHVAAIAALAPALATGLRQSMLHEVQAAVTSLDYGPGLVIFDAAGNPESVSPAAQRWIDEIVEVPAPSTPYESKVVQAIAARARAIAPGTDPLELAARSRVRTRSGAWLLLYGTRLSGAEHGRTAVIIQPATPHEVAPVIAMAYGLSPRECHLTTLCIQGRSTKEMAHAMSLSAFTIQDHMKSIFDKTGVRSRGELVGQIFLEHYAPRWEPAASPPSGWFATGIS